MANPIVQTITLAAAVANGVALAQTPAGAGPLTLNGSLVSGGVAQLTAAGSGTARQLLFAFSGADAGRTFVIRGTGPTGNVISETLAGANNPANATSVNNYQQVTSITVDAATAGTVTVGTNGVGASRILNVDTALNPSNTSVIIGVTGTVNYTLQYTLSDIQGGAIVWNNDPILSAQTAGGGTAYAMPISGLQVLLNSGTGTVTTTVLQSGLGS